jgi:hypothetical protein
MPTSSGMADNEGVPGSSKEPRAGAPQEAWQAARISSSSVRTDNHPKVCFWAAVGEEPEIEVMLV